jgi:hypothetical protein
LNKHLWPLEWGIHPISSDPQYGNSDIADLSFAPVWLPVHGVDWRFRFSSDGGDPLAFDPGIFEDLYLIVGYTLNV